MTDEFNKEIPDENEDADIWEMEKIDANKEEESND